MYEVLYADWATRPIQCDVASLPSPSLGVCVDVFLVQCRVCLSTSSLCQVAGQEEGVC